LSRLEESPLVTDIVLVVRREDMDYCQHNLLGPGDFAKISAVVPGGAERRESVYRGLGETDADMVLIHDAVRPFISSELLLRVIEATREYGAALPALRVVETIKEVAGGRVIGTPRRETLWRAQTPQGFFRPLLQRAHEEVGVDDGVTDDAMLIERLGHAVHIVEGEVDNLKITTRDDLAWAEWKFKERDLSMATGLMRVGQGYDVHRLEAGRKLVLGGVVIPFELGLAGHSDADVLTHAIIDALLGALSAGDIGQLFPDTDAQYENISSLILLERVRALVEERGAQIVHIDAVVIAQRPKLAPHIDAMRAELAATLGLSVEQVSLKATTTERLGFVGREEGMAAQAVATVRV
jgi:2-C-methyl-D-erythritol 4-phosphate cytidylyltransferase/2-C-methyl-D-erythritol 2,4-cyclodiphosphate synthase